VQLFNNANKPFMPINGGRYLAMHSLINWSMPC
jgi:hypothetical protein